LISEEAPPRKRGLEAKSIQATEIVHIFVGTIRPKSAIAAWVLAQDRSPRLSSVKFAQKLFCIELRAAFLIDFGKIREHPTIPFYSRRRRVRTLTPDWLCRHHLCIFAWYAIVPRPFHECLERMFDGTVAFGCIVPERSNRSGRPKTYKNPLCRNRFIWNGPPPARRLATERLGVRSQLSFQVFIL